MSIPVPGDWVVLIPGYWGSRGGVYTTLNGDTELVKPILKFVSDCFDKRSERGAL